MAAKPPQLSLDELLRLKWLLAGVMSLVALWTVFFLDVEALSLVAIASTVVLATLVWPGLPGKLPRALVKLAVPAIIVASAIDLYASPDTLPVLIRLAILLVLYRAVAYRRKREDLQLLVLGLFLIVVAGVLTVSLGFAVLLLLFTAVALGFLFVVTMVDATQVGTLRTEEGDSAWQRLSWRRFFGRLMAVADWRVLVFAAALFATVVAMSGVLFLLIPRFDIGSGFFLDRYITRKSSSGFSDTLRFGDVTELTKDDSVAMRVDLTDASGIRAVPYWRMVVLDDYTPEGFRVSNALRNHLLMSRGRLERQLAGRKSNVAVRPVGGLWTFYIEPGVSRYLPLPGSFGTIRLREHVPIQLSLEHRIASLRVEPATLTAYQLEDVAFEDSVGGAALAQVLRARAESGTDSQDADGYALRALFSRPIGEANASALERMLAEITGGERLDAAAFADRATRWLRQRHAYALAVRLPRGIDRDGIVRWLESNEPGFCEYFAAGLTVLARAAGHPARVVVGFRGGALNAFENYFMVRNSDAHAWVEIFDGVSRWVRYDPTPGATAVDQAVEAVVGRQEDGSWAARWDSLRILWYRRIVNFDARQQVRMLEQVKAFTTDSGTALRSRLEHVARELRAWLAQPWDARRVLRTGAIGAAASVAIWLLFRLGATAWQRWSGRTRTTRYDPMRAKAGMWLARLRTLPADGAVIGELQRLRYGRRETWPEPAAVFRRAREARRHLVRSRRN